MKIDSDEAISYFFPATSMKYVYYEAIANSIDAQADLIKITISVQSFSEPGTLEISIIDNGKGFITENFTRFNEVLNKSDVHHKGLGRLVFLKYFKRVAISSYCDEGFREFDFTSSFDGKYKMSENLDSKHETTLLFTDFTNTKIKEYAYINPTELRDDICNHFLPLLYQIKNDNRNLRLEITLRIKEDDPDSGLFNNSTAYLDVKELRELKSLTVKDNRSLTDSFTINYNIEKSLIDESSIISAICTDGRAIPVEIVSSKTFPKGYKMLFLLYSSTFTGRTSSDREKLTFQENEMTFIKSVFTQQIASITKNEIPAVKKHIEDVTMKIEDHYPHLNGYFDSTSIGLIEESNSIQVAQNQFFKDQRKFLEAEEIPDDKFMESLECSSRILTEYILYRTKIIQKLQKIDGRSHESEIHNLLVPKNAVYQGKQINEVFSNNAWVIDDKFMTYSRILSDKEIEEIYKSIDVTGSHVYSETENGRPDITIMFSNDPNSLEKVDAIVVELKKRDLKLANKETIISQLRQRARRLLEFYPTKIQRIWFYGIIDFDKEFISSIKEDGYRPLYSKGEVYCKVQKIIVDSDKNLEFDVDMFLLSIDALLKDAEARNSTFLKILKEGFKSSKG